MTGPRRGKVGAAAGRKGTNRIRVGACQPPFGGAQRDLQVDADRVTGQQPPDVVGSDQGEDRQENDGEAVFPDGAADIHVRKYVWASGAR
jgi:hypothetical protein